MTALSSISVTKNARDAQLGRARLLSPKKAEQAKEKLIEHALNTALEYVQI